MSIEVTDRIVTWSTPFDRDLLGKPPAYAKTHVPWREMKPVGVWYALGTEWIDWCRNESFRTSALLHVYKLVVDESRIRMIRTPDELLDFTTRFRSDAADEFEEKFPENLRRPGGSTMWIDWVRAAEGYAGIEIAPYQWEHRLGLMWYYGWDVASGCIWDPTAILDAVPVALPPVPEDTPS